LSLLLLLLVVVLLLLLLTMLLIGLPLPSSISRWNESSSPIKLFSACIESSKDLSVRSYLVHTLLVLILEMVLLLLLCIWFIVINSLQMTEILGKVNMKSKPKKVQWFQIVFGAVLLSLRLTRQTKKL